VGCCQHGNEPSGSIKGRELLDQLSDYKLFKKDSAPWSYFIRSYQGEFYGRGI